MNNKRQLASRLPGGPRGKELYLSLIEPTETDLAPARVLISRRSSCSERPDLRRFLAKEVDSQFARMSEYNSRLYSAKLRRDELSSKQEQSREQILRKSQLKMEMSERKRNSNFALAQQRWQGHKQHLDQIASKFRKSARESEENSLSKMKKCQKQFLNYLTEKREEEDRHRRQVFISNSHRMDELNQSMRHRESLIEQEHERLLLRVAEKSRVHSPSSRSQQKAASFSVGHEQKVRYCLDYRKVQQTLKQRRQLNQYVSKMNGKAQGKGFLPSKASKGRNQGSTMSPASPASPSTAKKAGATTCQKDHFKMVQRKFKGLGDSESYNRRLVAIQQLKKRQLQQRVEQGERRAELSLVQKRRQLAHKELREKVQDMRLRAQFRFMNLLKG